MLMNVMMEIRDQEMVAVMHVEQKEDGHVVEEHLGWKMCALRNAVIGGVLPVLWRQRPLGWSMLPDGEFDRRKLLDPPVLRRPSRGPSPARA